MRRNYLSKIFILVFTISLLAFPICQAQSMNHNIQQKYQATIAALPDEQSSQAYYFGYQEALDVAKISFFYSYCWSIVLLGIIIYLVVYKLIKIEIAAQKDALFFKNIDVIHPHPGEVNLPNLEQELDFPVKQNNLALRQSVKQLQAKLRQLKQTQAQLVQKEKMSSLGHVVAGIAHEINNPVNFIYANLDHANAYIKDLVQLIHLYQNQFPTPTPEIEAYAKAIDLEFLQTDLLKLLSSAKSGSNRIRDVVIALRNFSRLDEADLKQVDIHEGIDSTLLILQHRLAAKGKVPNIQIIQEYGQLPTVECYVSQLNQVFFHLLNNAIDAIEEGANQQTSGNNIRIRTKLLANNHISITIADNGIGMTKKVQQKLFEPFFTTKPVGQGTGLSLAISYHIIVMQHGGQLQYRSHIGKGSEFIVTIPLDQNHSSLMR